MSVFTMPSLGADMDDGVLNQWLVAPGDTVARGDIVAVVGTDKSDIEVEVFHPGVVRELLVTEGTRVTVGTPIAQIDGADEVPPVVATAPAPATAPISDDRRAIAALMTRSWQEIPHFHVTARMDLTRVHQAVRAHNANRPPGERMVTTAVLLCAVACAAVDVPEVNGWWQGDAFQSAAGVDLGVVVARRGSGIEVVTITQAQTLSPSATMAALDEAVGRVRQGRLRSTDVAPASLTVTALGDLGADTVLGVIHPPQVALVGFGRERMEPVACDGQVVLAPVVDVSVAGDHRALDGLVAARFLQRLAARLGDMDVNGTDHDG
jgi:pyruvate dehydrogenase E2 component (dihydrolipoamide acetyltransferase)